MTQLRSETLTQSRSATTVSRSKMQEDDYSRLTEDLHAVLLSVQGLDHKLNLAGQDRARNKSSQGQIVKVLQGTKYAYSVETTFCNLHKSA